MKKHLISVLMALMFIGGCASVRVQNTPTFLDWETGKKINFTTVTLTDVNAFAPTTTVKIVLQCEPLDEESKLSESKCRAAAVGRQDSAPGVVTGFGSTVINSAAIVGGAYFIGDGISKSGDESNQEITDIGEVYNTDASTGGTVNFGD